MQAHLVFKARNYDAVAMFLIKDVIFELGNSKKTECASADFFAGHPGKHKVDNLVSGIVVAKGNPDFRTGD